MPFRLLTVVRIEQKINFGPSVKFDYIDDCVCVGRANADIVRIPITGLVTCSAVQDIRDVQCLTV